jgi:hypothetical protein
MGMSVLLFALLTQGIEVDRATALPLEPVRLLIRSEKRDDLVDIQIAAEGKDFVSYRPAYAPACILGNGFEGKRSFTVFLPQAPGRYRVRALDRETSVLVSKPLLAADVDALDSIRSGRLYDLLSEESRWYPVTDTQLADAKESVAKFPSSAYTTHLRLGIAAVHFGRKQYAEAMDWGGRSGSLEGAMIAGESGYLLRKPKEARPFLSRVKDSGLLNFYRAGGLLEDLKYFE